MKRKKLSQIVAKLCAAAVLATSVAWPAPVAKAADAKISASEVDLKLWYDEEAADSYDGWEKWSLPIGNSGIGASVFGGVDRERIQLNEKSLWSGGPADDREYLGGNLTSVTYNDPYNNNQQVTTSMADLVKVIQRLFNDGRDSEASNLCEKLIGVSDDNGNDGYGYYLSYGNMYLDFDYGAESYTTSNYKRSLDLRTAIAAVEYDVNGVHYTRESFVSYPDNVLVTKLTADQAAIDVNIDVQPDNAHGGGSNTLAADTYTRSWKTTVKDHLISVEGSLTDNQMQFVSHTKVIADGTTTDNEKTISVADAKSVTIITSIGTDYKNDYPEYRTGETAEQVSTRVLNYVTKASAKTYETLKDNHIKDYDNIFGRVELDLGQAVSTKTTDALLAAYKNGSASETERRYLEVMLFQYGRFLTIESSRETPKDDQSRATLPSNLQGIWVGANNSAWHSDYHLNVNLQMNYWPTYSTNMAECAQPLVDYVDSLREPGRVTAKLYAGIESTDEKPENGFMAHTQNNPFGWTCPGWVFDWGWSPAAVPWILQNCWEYYEYTGDLEYMRDYIYPMLKEEAILYDQMLVRDKDGKLVSSPSFSPEHGPKTAGNTYEQSLIWQLYEDVITAAEILKVDEELITRWRSNQENLKGPIEIGKDGQIKEWYIETYYNKDENGNNLSREGYAHRHLSHMLGLFPGDLIQTNKDWIEAARVSMENRTDESTGWGMGQRINTWARLGDGNKAYKLIGDLFARGILTNLWDTHAPFQIDGNFGYTSGVAEMLLQSNMGYINVLPALPNAWATGTVEGLVARGDFEIDMTWVSKNLTQLDVLSNDGNECILEYPQISKAKVFDANGNEVAATVVSEDRISFKTEAGKTYTVQEIPEKKIEAPEKANAYVADNQVLVTFDKVDRAESYNLYESKDGETYYKIAELEKNEYYGYTYAEGKTYKLTSVLDNLESTPSKVITPTKIEVVDKIDDRDGRIAYSSGWGEWSESGRYDNTEKFSQAVGASAEFYFYGNSIDVIGMKNVDCHTFDLYIDEQLVQENVDTNGAREFQAVLASVDDLEEGIHKIKIVVKQNKVSLDAFEFGQRTVLDAPVLTVTQPTTGTTLQDATLPAVDPDVFEDVAANPATLTTENLVIQEVDGYQAFSGKVTADGTNSDKFDIYGNEKAFLIKFKVNVPATGNGRSGDKALIGKMDNQYGLQLKDNNQIEFYANANGGWPNTRSAAVSAGWHDVIAIYQPGTGFILYVDNNVTVKNQTDLTLGPNSDCKFTIGYNSTKSGCEFTNQIADVEMYVGDQVPTIGVSDGNATTTKAEVVTALTGKTPMFKLDVKAAEQATMTASTQWTTLGGHPITSLKEQMKFAVVNVTLTAVEGYKFAENSKPTSIKVVNGGAETTVAPDKVTISGDKTEMVVSYRFYLDENLGGFETTDVPLKDIAGISTGTYEDPTLSKQDGWDGKDGDGAYLVDNDNVYVTIGGQSKKAVTKWHSKYTGGTGQAKDFWVDFELTDAKIVDGVRVLPHHLNGQVTKYEVWVSTEEDAVWGIDYQKVCEGTWNHNSNGTSTWKTAKFEAIEAKHIRLVAVETKDNGGNSVNSNIALREMRITVPSETLTFTDFQGGSLRRNATPAEKTNLRFGYEILELPADTGLTVKTWKWNWGLSKDELKREVSAAEGQQPNFVMKDGKKISNLVITGIPVSEYGTTIYSQLAMVYVRNAEGHTKGETLTVYTNVEERSVEQVVDGILADEVAKDVDKTYANAIKEAMK